MEAFILKQCGYRNQSFSNTSWQEDFASKIKHLEFPWTSLIHEKKNPRIVLKSWIGCPNKTFSTLSVCEPVPNLLLLHSAPPLTLKKSASRPIKCLSHTLMTAPNLWHSYRWPPAFEYIHQNVSHSISNQMNTDN